MQAIRVRNTRPPTTRAASAMITNVATNVGQVANMLNVEMPRKETTRDRGKN